MAINPRSFVTRHVVLAVVAPATLRHLAGDYPGEVLGLANDWLTPEHPAALTTDAVRAVLGDVAA